MKICVFGSGAIGSNLAARFMQNEAYEVSVVCRGEHLRVIQETGLVLESPKGRFVGRPFIATDNPGDLPAQDIVFVTLKTYQQASVAHAIAKLLGHAGIAIFVSNGIPWWWNYAREGRGGPLTLLDPDGALWARVGPERVLGCVVYSANEILAPGVVRHLANDRWLLGEPSGGISPRLDRVTGMLASCDVGGEGVANLRREIWRKLLRNAPLNALCALTHRAIDELADDPNLLTLLYRIIDEVVLIAASQGEDISTFVEAAREAPRRGGAISGPTVRGVKPSMLQDIESCRPIEVESIFGQVWAFGKQAHLACPTLDIVVRLLRGRDASIRRNQER